jgi:hypothetical protein
MGRGGGDEHGIGVSAELMIVRFDEYASDTHEQLGGAVEHLASL